MSTKPSIAALFLSLTVMGCAMAAAGGTSANSSLNSAATGTASAQSEGSLSGENARLAIGGDIVEIRQGKVFVNGVSYGNVSSRSRVRYRIQGDQRQLFVDGEERHPQR